MAAKLNPFEEMMQRMERLQRNLEDGTVEPGTASAITGAARVWLSGVNTALRVHKSGVGQVTALLQGSETK